VSCCGKSLSQAGQTTGTPPSGTLHAYTEVLRNPSDGRLCRGLVALAKTKSDESRREPEKRNRRLSALSQDRSSQASIPNNSTQSVLFPLRTNAVSPLRQSTTLCLTVLATTPRVRQTHASNSTTEQADQSSDYMGRCGVPSEYARFSVFRTLKGLFQGVPFEGPEMSGLPPHKTFLSAKRCESTTKTRPSLFISPLLLPLLCSVPCASLAGHLSHIVFSPNRKHLGVYVTE
jgi:hypothetical protein